MYSRRRRIAYVVNALHPGGTERLATDMSVALSADYDVSVICLDQPGIWAARLRSRGIPVYCVWRQPGFDFGTSVRLSGYFSRLEIDIIHAHQCTPWFYSALSRLLYSRPRLLLEEHGRFYPEYRNLKRILINRVLIARLTHEIVAVSGDIRDHLVEYEGLQRRKISVVPNGTKAPEEISDNQRRSFRAEFGFDDNDFVVGTVGRLDPIKNLPMLLAAVEACIGTMSKLRVLIVGDGPELNHLRADASGRGLDGHVRFAGFRPDAPRIMQCLDAFVLCSFSEGTSMALLESLASGVPSIVTDVGGNSEVVRDGVDGRVIDSDDSMGLASAIRELAKDLHSAKKMGESGRARFSEKYTFQEMIESYRAIYGKLVA